MARGVIHPQGVTLRSVVPYVGAPEIKARRLVLAIRYHSHIGNPGEDDDGLWSLWAARCVRRPKRCGKRAPRRCRPPGRPRAFSMPLAGSIGPRSRNDRRGCRERRFLDLALPVLSPLGSRRSAGYWITACPSSVASGTRSCAASRCPSAQGGAHRGAAGRRSRRLGWGSRSRHASRSRGAGWR